MKNSSIAVFFIIFSLILAYISFAQGAVGVSPGTVNLGKVEAGTTKLVNFYIITPSEETILIKLEPERVTMNADSINDNTSEEDITSWVKIINNPVELEPTNGTLKTVGGVIKGQRQVSFLIDIPKNAEPGEHIVSIKPVPLTSQESTAPVGSRVVAITSVKVLLDVIGSAIRNGVILDVEAGQHVNNILEINTYFQNTGTTTVSATGTQRMYDKNGNLIKEISLGKGYVKPKEIRTLKGYLTTTELPLDDYQIYTVIDYNTGRAEKSSFITLTPPTTMSLGQEAGLFTSLLLIVIIIIFVVSAVIYRRIK
ncbi:MAG: hypothetical protein ABIE55_02065 [Candidatus Aenigmatarchaeota archaeon]